MPRPTGGQLQRYADRDDSGGRGGERQQCGGKMPEERWHLSNCGARGPCFASLHRGVVLPLSGGLRGPVCRGEASLVPLGCGHVVAAPDSPTPARAPLGIGIVGCGRAAEDLHLPALARMSSATAVAAVDVDPAALAHVSGKYGIPRAYHRLDELLADPAVAVVIVCTPPATHAEIALAAVAAGKHVLVEKPLALLPADTKRLVKAERHTGSVTAVGLNLRCHRLVETARGIVASGAIGPISTLRTTWTAGYAHGRPLPGWRRLRGEGGGVVYEVGTHHVDLWRYLLGDEITALTALSRSGEEDDEAAVLSGRSAGGVLVSGVLSDNAPDANEVDIVGRDGRVRFSLYRGDSLDVTTKDPDYGPAARARTLVRRAARLPAAARAARGGGDFQSSYVRQLERLVAAAHGEGAPAATWADGLKAAQLIETALDTARNGNVEVSRA